MRRRAKKGAGRRLVKGWGDCVEGARGTTGSRQAGRRREGITGPLILNTTRGDASTGEGMRATRGEFPGCGHCEETRDESKIALQVELAGFGSEGWGEIGGTGILEGWRGNRESFRVEGALQWKCRRRDFGGVGSEVIVRWT